MPRAGTRASQSQATQKSYGRRGRAAQESESEPEQQNGHDDEDDSDEEERPRRGAKASQASQSQRQSQSQRRRQETPDDDDEEGSGEDGDSGNKLDAQVHAIVRLALAQEFKRTSLKRDDINKKALKGDSRAFKDAFDRAQSTLRKTFGFELVELVSRQERDRILHGKEAPEPATQDGKKKAVQPTATKQYVLRSALDPELIAAASVIDRELAALEAAERAEDEQLGLARDETDPVPEGSILAQLDYDAMGPQSLGLLHVVLALIVVSGRTINEFQLRNMLKKMRVGPSFQVQLPITATAPSMTLENWFTTMIRQGYLERSVIPVNGTGATQGKRRVRARMNTDEDNNDVVELRWGERAHAEISEKAVAEWIVDFMLEADAEPEEEDEDEELPARQRREREQEREKEREKKRKAKEIMLKDVRRAAGGLEDYHGGKE